jgi:Ner family transcriptional regulator
MSPAPWHPADTLAQLKKRGTNMGRLAEHYGVIPETLRTAMYKPSPCGEVVIAHFLGVHPHLIWPDRWTADGKLANRKRMKRPYTVTAYLQRLNITATFPEIAGGVHRAAKGADVP